jgi:hypothetical protein
VGFRPWYCPRAYVRALDWYDILRSMMSMQYRCGLVPWLR